VLAAAFARTSMAQCDFCGDGGTFLAPAETVPNFPQEILDQLTAAGIPTSLIACGSIASLAPSIPTDLCDQLFADPAALAIL